MTHLAIKDVSVDFGGIHALKNVTFGLEAGSIVGLIGPNGAGKSTAIDLISGFKLPDRGTVTFSAPEQRRQVGGQALGVVDSGVPGPKGNRELFVHLAEREEPELDDRLEEWIGDAVGGAG